MENPFDTQGEQPTGPALKAPPVTLALVLVLLAIKALLDLMPLDERLAFVQPFVFFPGALRDALVGASTISFDLWTLFTYPFVNAGWIATLVNVGLILAFGAFIEKNVGRLAVLLVFFLAAVGGALTQTFLNSTTHPVSFLVSASTCMHGLMAATFVLAMGHGTSPAFLQIAFILTLVQGVLAELGAFGPAPSFWMANVGGILTGVFLGLYWRKRFL